MVLNKAIVLENSQSKNISSYFLVRKKGYENKAHHDYHSLFDTILV